MPPEAPKMIGRYALFGPIAAGGMATVHFGRLLGPVGFARTVAIKRLHPHLASDPEFVALLLDEARLAGRIRHPNVVSTVDVVAAEGELFIVMEYVQGESLARLIRATRDRDERVRPSIVSAVVSGALHGLHAAHEALGDHGEPLNIVHRDVSPQNIVVGADGLSRVLDFGVAKAASRLQTTREGQVKGKLAYMAPEQIRAGRVSRQTDVYAAGVVLWEALTGVRLFSGDNDGMVLEQVLLGVVDPPSSIVPSLPTLFDDIVARATARDPAARYQTGREMAVAIERACPPALASEVGEWVDRTATMSLKERALRMVEIESTPVTSAPPTSKEALSEVRRTGPLPAARAQDERARALEPEVLSQSTLSVSRGRGGPDRPEPSRRGAIALGVLLVGVLTGVFVAGRRLGMSTVPPPSVVTVPTPAAQPLVLVTDAAPVSAASASSDAVGAPKPVPSSRAPSGAASAARVPSPLHGVDCKVPYTRDAEGHILWKRQCL